MSRLTTICSTLAPRASISRRFHHILRASFVLLPALLAAGLLPPHRALAAAAPCDRVECRQFDFWVGDWDVFTADGKLAGTNRVERMLNGCVIQENWRGARGLEGKSFNLWTAADSLWHQTWVDGSGSQLVLAGTFHDGAMRLDGAGARPGSSTRNRITWTPNADGSVTQHWEVSRDAGATWSDAFFGIYRRQKPAGK